MSKWKEETSKEMAARIFEDINKMCRFLDPYKIHTHKKRKRKHGRRNRVRRR